jgi:hypothetical protein
MRKLFIALSLVVLVTGCTDVRIKRQINLTDVKTQVAANEFNKAATDKEKVQIADKYLNGAPDKGVPGMKHMTAVVSSYFNHKNPEDPLNLLVKKKPAE